MDAIFKAIGDAIGSVVANPTVGVAVRVVAAYVVAVWLATALWAFVDMRRRTANPLIAYASAAAVVLASPVLFPFVVLVHRVVRPAATVADRRLAELRDTALTRELDQPLCPTCRAGVEEDWLICPNCRRQLGHRCDHCGRTAGLDWDVCAWCGSTLGGDEPRSVVKGEPAIRT